MTAHVESAASGSLTRIARGGSANLAGSAVNAAFGLALTWVVTRFTEPGAAGSFFALTSMVLVVAAVAQLGSDVSLVRFLPGLLVEDRPAQAVNLARLATAIAVLAGTLIAGVMILFAPRLQALVVGSESAVSTGVVVVLALSVPVAGVMSTALSASRGLGVMRPTVLVDKVARPVLQVIGVLLALAAGAGLVGLTLGWSVPYLLCALAALAWFELLLVRRHGRVPVRFRGLPVGEYARYTWPRLVSLTCQAVLQRSDIILVSALRSPAEAAVYTVATRLFVVGQTVTQAIQQVSASHTSRLHAAGSHEETKVLVQTVTAWTMSLAWPLSLTCLVLAPHLLALFGGDTYRSGSGVVVLLALAALLVAAGGPVDLVLLMTGRSGLSLVNSITALVVNIGLNLLLIPHLGILGAAVAWAAAILVRNGLGVVQVHASLHWYPLSRAAVVVAGLALLFFAVLPGAVALVAEPGPWVLVATLAVGGTGYAAALWRFRRLLSLQVFARIVRRR